MPGIVLDRGHGAQDRCGHCQPGAYSLTGETINSNNIITAFDMGY